MGNLAPFVLTGLLIGLVYGLAASGLVLTYKTSGLFNLGYGAILTAATVVFYALKYTAGLPWEAAFAISVFVAGPLMGFAMEFVARHLARQSTTYKIAATIGLLVIFPPLCILFYPQSQTTGLLVQPFLPFSDRARYHVKVLGVTVFGDQILTAVIVLVAVSGLYSLVRFTRTGTAMRAVADDAALLSLQATNPVRVRRLAWLLGCTFASLSGVLILPSIGLQPFTLTYVAMYSFAAAAIGGFSNIPLAFVGGLAVGIVQDVSGYIVAERHWSTLGSLSSALPFVILVAVLLALPIRRLAVSSATEFKSTPRWTAPIQFRLTTALVLIVILALVPSFAPSKLIFISFGLCQAILILSLGLLVKTSGQVSLCQASFAGVGAAAFSQFSIQMGLPWLVALLLAGLATVPVGVLVALPAMRLSGIYLALLTFGFGLLVQEVIFPQTWMYSTIGGSRVIPSPFGRSDATSQYYFVLIAFILTAVVIVVLAQSRIGRVLRGMAGTQTGVSTLGLSIPVSKLIVFSISAFIASIAGVMYGMLLTNIDGSVAAFQPFNSLVLLAILVIQPFGEPWYALLAGLSAVIPGFFHGQQPTLILDIFFGVSAILVAIQGGPPGAPDWLKSMLSKYDRRRVPAESSTPTSGSEPRKSGPENQAGLEVASLTVRFGGILAVDNLSLNAPSGSITALVGPNGAGKTTAFNACSGINRRVKGRVTFAGVDISSKSAAARARLGLGRTFQRLELCEALDVYDNVALGIECPRAGSRVMRQLFASRRETAEIRRSVMEALELCGIDDIASVQAGSLSTGRRRLVELARCLAGPYHLLLLDEPSSGLDRAETDRFADLLCRIVEERGVGVLLVEHDMSLVMRICKHIYVLDAGELIFEGRPDEVAANELVRAAYLGTSAPVEPSIKAI